jgi:putative ABC transport system substrate-binding protein
MNCLRRLTNPIAMLLCANKVGDRPGHDCSTFCQAGKSGSHIPSGVGLGRRDFMLLVLLGLSLLMPAVPAGAQSTKPPRIGVLLSGFSIQSPETEQFREALRTLQYEEGKNIVLEWRSAEGNYSNLPRLLYEIIQSRPDILVVEGTVAALQIKQANLGIPVVMVAVNDPLASGLVESLTRPGGDMTGLSMMATDIAIKRLQLLKESNPSLKNVGVLWDASVTWHESTLVALDQAAGQLDTWLTPVPVAGMDGIALAFAELRRARVKAVYVLDSALLGRNVAKVLLLAKAAKLPVVYGHREWVKEGALLSYSADFGDMFRRAATYVDRILKREKPADLPIEQPTKFDFAVSLKTAKALGITIPESILTRADEVIR